MLSILQFSKSYYQRTVLQIEELVFAPGAHWIQGENGSGKSTLFKAIGSLIPFQGFISFQQFDNRKHRVPFQRALGFAEAEPLYPAMLTGHDLISFTRQIKKASTGSTFELVESLGMIDYLHQPISTFSSGMLKKLSLAIAFVGKPDLLVLDEPYITLDADARGVLNNILSTYLQQGATLLFSSHQAIEGIEIAAISHYKIHQERLIRT